MALGSTLGLSEAIATEPLCLDTSGYMTERERKRESAKRKHTCVLSVPSHVLSLNVIHMSLKVHCDQWIGHPGGKKNYEAGSNGKSVVHW